MGAGLYCVPHDRYYGIFPCPLCEEKKMASEPSDCTPPPVSDELLDELIGPLPPSSERG